MRQVREGKAGELHRQEDRAQERTEESLSLAKSKVFVAVRFIYTGGAGVYGEGILPMPRPNI